MIPDFVASFLHACALAMVTVAELHRHVRFAPKEDGADIARRHVTAQLDDVALDVVRETARFLGAGIANLLNILNPEVVVVCGEGIASGSSTRRRRWPSGCAGGAC